MEKDSLDIRSYRIRSNEEKHLFLPRYPYSIILVVETDQILPNGVIGSVSRLSIQNTVFKQWLQGISVLFGMMS